MARTFFFTNNSHKGFQLSDSVLDNMATEISDITKSIAGMAGNNTIIAGLDPVYQGLPLLNEGMIVYNNELLYVKGGDIDVGLFKIHITSEVKELIFNDGSLNNVYTVRVAEMGPGPEEFLISELTYVSDLLTITNDIETIKTDIVNITDDITTLNSTNWEAVTIKSGFANAIDYDLECYKEPNGRVSLKGWIEAVSIPTQPYEAANLPYGPEEVIKTIISDDSNISTTVLIRQSGAIEIPNAALNQKYCFDGVSFFV